MVLLKIGLNHIVLQLAALASEFSYKKRRSLRVVKKYSEINKETN